MFKFGVTVVALVLSTFLVESKASCADRGMVAIPTLDIPKFVGKWYEIKRIANDFEVGDCVEGNYVQIDDKSFSLTVTGIKDDGSSIESTGVATSADGSGNLTVVLSGETTRNYFVVDTDYDDFNILYSCTDGSDGTTYEFLWLLSRTPTASSNAEAQAQKVFAEYGLNEEDMFVDNQDPEFCKRS